MSVVSIGGGEQEIVPTEVKTRVGISNVEAAVELAEKNSGTEYIAGDAVYGVCSSNDIAK